MRIYTTYPDGERLTQAKALGMGVMITPADKGMNRRYRELPCAMDNGAWGCWTKGYPFSVVAERFRKTLLVCHRHGIRLEFLVAPDIVAGGERSLEFSMAWAKGELIGAPRLALAVQDGMSLSHMTAWNVAAHFSHLFVGGTRAWKWETAQQWVLWAHDHGMQCHIGQCGRLETLRRAAEIGADSVDSASFARHGTFRIVEEFMRSSQSELWGGLP